jgi:hypothetical protein
VDHGGRSGWGGDHETQCGHETQRAGR